MRVLIQRVARAQAHDKAESNKMIASIDRGLLILAGFEANDSPVSIEQLIQKIKNLRIFSDELGKLNLAGPEVDAQYLLVSQFTLYADCRYGNRPSFEKAAGKARAKEYYEHFTTKAKQLLGSEKVEHTPFASDLAIELVNDGPVTIWLDGKEVL